MRLLMRVLTPARADRGVLRERCLGQHHVLAVEAHGGAGSAACVVVVRMVQCADVPGQRVWGCGVGVFDAVFRRTLQDLHSASPTLNCSLLVHSSNIGSLRSTRRTRLMFPVPERGEAAGAAPHG